MRKALKTRGPTASPWCEGPRRQVDVVTGGSNRATPGVCQTPTNVRNVLLKTRWGSYVSAAACSVALAWG